MKEQPNGKATGRSGVADFLKFMHDGQPEWSVAAVKAAIDEVSDELVDFRGAKSFSKAVAIKPGGEYEDVAPLVAVIEVRGNPWTVIYRSLLYVDEHHIEAMAEEAKELSARLNTRAISFAGEDTSGANQYELFEKGKVLEQVEWEVGGEFFRFKSSLRKRPDLEKVTDEFVDGLFREEGIYLPVCHPANDGESSWLAAEKSVAEAIDRADLIEMDEEEDEDDYDEGEEG